MKKRAKRAKFPEDLFLLMEGFDLNDLQDWAWQLTLEDSVGFYNTKNGTNFDQNEAFLAYCEWKSAF